MTNKRAKRMNSIIEDPCEMCGDFFDRDKLYPYQEFKDVEPMYICEKCMGNIFAKNAHK